MADEPDLSKWQKSAEPDLSKWIKPVTGSASPASASVSVPPAEPPAAGGAAPPVKRTPTPPIGGDLGTVKWETPEENATRMAASKQASQPPGIGESVVQGAKEGFGNEPATLGFDYRNPLKSFQDVIDLAGRATNAGFGAIAGAAGDTAQKLGMSQGMAQRGKRDVMQGGQVAAAAGMLPEAGLGADVMPKAPEPPASKPPVKSVIETGDPQLMNEFNMMLKKPPAMGKPANTPGPTEVPKGFIRTKDLEQHDPMELARQEELTSKRAKNISEEMQKHYTNVEDRILGDDADAWRAAHKNSNRLWDQARDAEAKAQDKIVSDIEAKHSKEEVNKLYGIGETNSQAISHEDWQDLSNKLREVEGNRDDAIEELSQTLRDLPSDTKNLTGVAKIKLAIIQHAMNEESKRGGDPIKLLRDGFLQSGKRYGNGADAAELVSRDIENLQKLMKEPERSKPQLSPSGKSSVPPPQSVGAAATPPGQTPPTPHWQSMDYISDAVRGNPKLEAQLQAQKDANAGPIGKAASFLRNMWAPQTVSESAGRAEGAIRETRGIAERDTAQASASFEQFRKSVAQAPEADRWALTDYMETRSKGKTLPPALKQFQPIADAIREQMEKVRGKLEDIEKLQGTKYRPPMDFIDDYIHHAWQDPAKARLAFQGPAAPKTGSGGFTKKRQIPTMAEGIKKGLVPVTSDPIEMSMNYIDNANKYIASAKAFEIGRRSGDIKWYSQGKAPPGWTKLDKVRINHLGQEAYAPEGYAQIFNNFHSGGFFDWKVKHAGSAFQAARQVSNGITQFKLGLSGFHAFTEGTEAYISGIAQAVGEGLRGHPIMAAKSLAKAYVRPFEPMLPTRFSPGRKLQQQYQGIADHGVNFAKIADLAARSNFRTVSYDKQLKAGYGSITKSIKRGAMRMEMADAMKKVKGPMSAATQLWRGVARVMDTIASPIFEHYVPQLKNAAFYGKMDSWLKMNPTADEAAQLKAAREIGNSIDNRFGEMNQDNIFWNQTMKQSLQVGMTSYSWTTGTVKEIGGGGTDLARGRLTPKAEYVIALPIGVAMINSIYQYLMTGEPPKDYKDVISPRTGGVIPKTKYRPEMPERAMLPGYIKDVFGWAIDPKQEAENKIAPGIQMAGELLFRHDWRGDPIDDPSLGVPGWLKASGMSIMNAFTPISMDQVLGKNVKQGTGIPGFQRGMGIRPAPMYQQDPKGYAAMEGSMAESAWEKKMFHDATTAKNNGDMSQYNAIMQDIRRRRLIQKNQQTQNKGIQ